MVKLDSDKDLLLKILNPNELETLKKGYGLYNSLENERYKNFLLRRIEDIISIVRYIDLTYPNFSQNNYDCLAARVHNLEIAMRYFSNPSLEKGSLSFAADSYSLPRIMQSISSLDLEKYNEVNDLIASVANKTGKEVTINGSLKGLYGPTQLLLYYRNNGQVMVYDIVSSLRRANLDQAEIKAKCAAELEDIDLNIQSIYDEMIYSVLHYNVIMDKKGYGFSYEKGVILGK